MAFSVAEWREKNGPEEVELPSGSVALLRSPHILDLVAQGVIPATLVAELEGLERKSGSDLLQNADQVERFRGMLNAVAKAAFVMPPVGDEGTDEQLGVDEVSFEDRLFVFNRCTRGARRLEPFRAEPGGDVDGAPAGEDVREEAERDPAD